MTDCLKELNELTEGALRIATAAREAADKLVGCEPCAPGNAEKEPGPIAAIAVFNGLLRHLRQAQIETRNQLDRIHALI